MIFFHKHRAITAGLLTISLLILCSHNLFASNLAREMVTSIHLKKQLGSGEIIELGKENKKFVAVHEQSTLALKQGGIILLHDIDKNPDSPLVMRTLRTRLTDNGWDTLSIMMPMAGRQSQRDTYYLLRDEAIYRITEAVRFFERKNNINIGLIGHGMGANMAVNFQASTPLEIVRGMVLINSDSREKSTLESFKMLKIPVLDLFGGQSQDRVISSSPERKRAIGFSAGNLNYRQYKMLAANNDFEGLQDQLYLTVRAWLGKNIAGEEIMLRQDEQKPNN